MAAVGQSMEVVEAGSQLRSSWNPRKGGFRATMFVFGSVGLENVGYVANMVSLVLYFMKLLHFDLTGASTTLTNFMGAVFMITIVAGFISDTYMTRLNTVLVFAIFEIAGYILLTVQAQKSSLRPDPACLTCKLKGSNAYLFYMALGLLALGFGGTRGAMPALGADQFDQSNPKERKHLTSYFNWLLLSVTVGATIGVTVIVYISTEKNKWALSFLISMLLALASFVLLAFGKPFYRVRVPGNSPLLKLIEVVVVAIQNRKLSVPENSDELYEINEKNGYEYIEGILPHSSELSFFDKAAVLPEGEEPKPWKVCTVTQVEELKIIIRMLPILGSTIIMNTCLAQLQTFSIEQGNMMDLHLGPSFKIPPASTPVIPLVFMSILIPIYNNIVIPFVRRFTGHPSGITHLQRVGVGLVLSVVSMAIAALVEVKRRNAFNRDHKQISVFWLGFQYGIFGVADMFTLIGLMEFFYSEAPAGMRSLATSFTYLSLSFGYFLSSVFVHSINAVTAQVTPSKQGWLHGDNLNDNNLDLFYWFLSVLSALNFVLYLLCAKWYKYRGYVDKVDRSSTAAAEAGEQQQQQQQQNGHGVNAAEAGAEGRKTNGDFDWSINGGVSSEVPENRDGIVDDQSRVNGDGR